MVLRLIWRPVTSRWPLKYPVLDMQKELVKHSRKSWPHIIRFTRKKYKKISLKLAWSATKTSQTFENLDVASFAVILSQGFDKQNFQRINVNIFLPMGFNICFGCSKEPSHWDDSFQYPQHMSWLRNKKIKFSFHTLNESPEPVLLLSYAVNSDCNGQTFYSLIAFNINMVCFFTTWGIVSCPSKLNKTFFCLVNILDNFVCTCSFILRGR